MGEVFLDLVLCVMGGRGFSIRNIGSGGGSKSTVSSNLSVMWTKSTNGVIAELAVISHLYRVTLKLPARSA